jgi:hypothetical protein
MELEGVVALGRWRWDVSSWGGGSREGGDKGREMWYAIGFLPSPKQI